MKQTFMIITCVLIFFAACKSKKNTASAPAATTTTDPYQAQLAAVNTKFPGTTKETLQQGLALYYGACTRFHGAKEITSRSLEEWPSILDRMAPKSKITAEEKDAVW